MKSKMEAKTLEIHPSSELRGEIKDIGGSMSDDWNNIVLNQVVNALFLKHSDTKDVEKRGRGAIEALSGIKPQDEIEGMLGAQIIACHNASMECYRRAMLAEQTFEGRREALNQANKLSRTYAALVEGLNRHRGKGQQKVTVEHVHVHDGGQAIVGNVEAGGKAPKTKEQPHAITHASEPALWSPDAEGARLPIARNEER
jgi:hypothetical protein